MTIENIEEQKKLGEKIGQKINYSETWRERERE